jgi:hypothetical protein
MAEIDIGKAESAAQSRAFRRRNTNPVPSSTFMASFSDVP